MLKILEEFSEYVGRDTGINKEYIHNTMSMLKQYDKYRLKPHDDKIGPNINIGTKLPNL